MKTFKLHSWADDKPHRNTKTGAMERVISPRLRLFTPYVLVADRAAQSTSGATHLASPCEVDGVIRLDPMTHCGINTAGKPKPMQWVNRPTRITCKRCTVIALGDLARRKLLPGCP